MTLFVLQAIYHHQGGIDLRHGFTHTSLEKCKRLHFECVNFHVLRENRITVFFGATKKLSIKYQRIEANAMTNMSVKNTF